MSYRAEVVSLEAASDLDSFLSNNAAAHTVPLSILDRARRGPVANLLIALARDERGDVAAAGLRGGYMTMAVSESRDAAASAALAHAVAAVAPDLSGANGPQPAVADFAAAWARQRRCALREGMQEHLYRLGRLRPPAEVGGSARIATAPDVELLAAWMRAFDAEALSGTPASDRRSWIEDGLPRGEWWLWENGGPVSFTGLRTMPPAHARIGPVYTPPEHRGRGYASACVAAVSATVQAMGRECVLYTDVTNATANHIYTAIGYERIGEAAAFWFEPRPGDGLSESAG